MSEVHPGKGGGGNIRPHLSAPKGRCVSSSKYGPTFVMNKKNHKEPSIPFFGLEKKIVLDIFQSILSHYITSVLFLPKVVSLCLG